jgi:hypothetical protein
MSTWGEIARRCQEAKAGDRDLDYAIADLVRGVPRKGLRHGNVPQWSASVDAMLALIAENLPGKPTTMGIGTESCGASIWDLPADDAKPMGCVDAKAATLPIALLTAFALAIEAEEASQWRMECAS